MLLLKKLFLLILVFFLSACLNSKRNKSPRGDSQYFVREITANIRHRTIKPHTRPRPEKSLTPKEVADIMRYEIIMELDRRGLYYDGKSSDVIVYDLIVDYSRLFMVYTAHNYIGSEIDGYTAFYYKDDNYLGRNVDKTRRTSQLNPAQFINRIAKTLIFLYKKEDEILEVKALARQIARELIK